MCDSNLEFGSHRSPLSRLAGEADVSSFLLRLKASQPSELWALDAWTFDSVADIYDATRTLPEPVMRSILSAIKHALSDCTTIIDVGSGTGRFAKPLQEMGFGVIGVDVARGMLAKASEKGVRGLVVADAHSLPFKDESFDVVIIVHVLHLVKDWRTVASEISRVCRKRVVSLVGRTDGLSIRTEYLRLRSHFGHPLNRFEAGEEGLREIVEPAEVIKVEEYWSETNANEDISYLEERGSSRTWDLKEDVHRRIIAELRASYGGRVLRNKRLIELAIWHPDQLRRLS